MGFASEGQGCCAPSWQGWLWAPMAHATDVLVLLISVLVPSVSEGAFFIFYCFKMGDCFILTQQATMHTDGGMSSYTCTLRLAVHVHVHLGQHTCCSESRFGEVFDNHLQVRRDRCLLNGGHLQLIASLPN